MANEKITDLTAFTVLAATDVVVGVDDPAGTPVTKKLPLSLIVPSGGTAGQVLTKQSSSYADMVWSTPETPLVAEFEQQAAITTAAATKKRIPLTQIVNNIAGLTLASDVLQFVSASGADGVYLITGSILSPRRCGRIFPFLWNEAGSLVKSFPVMYNRNVSLDDIGNVSFSCVLTVSADINIGLYVLTETAGTQIATTLDSITPPYASISIVKLNS